MEQKSIKILLSYHKKDILFKDNILTPVHAGRKIAISTRNPQEENLKWLMENTVGDDTGENISDRNPLYNEMTTVYWAWKNYNDLGNPDYIGFMHYRRHFIFKEMDKPVYECTDTEENYFEKINYSEDNLQEVIDSCDFVCSAPHYRNTVYEHYRKNHDIADLDCVVDIINEKYPEYSKDTQDYLQGTRAYFCNMFIFDRDTFFEYCSWFFDITFELENRRDLSGKRLFVSEWLTGIFITSLLSHGKKAKFFPTMIIEGAHTIPLVFAADNNYAIPMCVALTSVFESAKSNTMYDVHLLMSGDFSEENLERLSLIEKKYANHCITKYNMKNEYADVEMNIKHISSATYYRLKLPSLLPNINKCIYLDVDVIVTCDLSEMFRINIDDKYIAGVRAAGYFWPDHHVRNRLEMLGIPSINQYVNAGVLLMNLAKMRKNCMEAVFEGLLEKNYQSQDQDILNKACYDRIRILPFKYNAMTKYNLAEDSSYKNDLKLQLAYTMKEWNEGRKKPVIIHYADKTKPWNDMSTTYADKWWMVASTLPFFNDVFTLYAPNVFDAAFSNRSSKVKFDQKVKETVKLKKDLQEQKKNVQTQKKKVQTQKKEIQVLKKKITAEKKEIKELKESETFKVGRVIVFIPRKMKRCYIRIKQYGLCPTIKYVVKKIQRK